ncbi:calmodulin-binding protein 25-like [Vicia villosa]|uniref:calmodulin-binding protein 25-like n=1 Tax=Vicia villosa TaxID=3911 RepID=UPI00273AF6FD|nr:calmodulin-binding protein 25-like [Vicia villosa]
MASSDNLTGIEPWMFRPTVADTWLAEYLSRDADTITKALHKTLSTSPEDAFSPFLNLTDSAVTATTTATPTVSSLSGSDQDSAPKRQRVAAAGKISKRKSRASKRSLTTFITADPANFREMVQQVTGARFGAGSNFSMAPIVKPEPHRMVTGGGRFSTEGCLPTLDTSAFLLDHNRQQQQQQPHQIMVGPNSDGPDNSGPGPFSFGQPIGGLDDDAGFVSAGLDFETFSSCFPTLESSWKVM